MCQGARPLCGGSAALDTVSAARCYVSSFVRTERKLSCHLLKSIVSLKMIYALQSGGFYRVCYRGHDVGSCAAVSKKNAIKKVMATAWAYGRLQEIDSFFTSGVGGKRAVAET